MSLLDINDFVICHENNDYKCCGYKINNELLKNNKSPLITQNSNNTNINNINNMSELFNNTAFPIGLLYNNYDDKHYLEENTNEVISDNLYEKLITFAKKNQEPNNKSKSNKTKSNKTKSNKTKSNKTKKLKSKK